MRALLARVADTVAARPDATAVLQTAGETLTWSALDARVRCVFQPLALGLDPRRRAVAVCLPRSAEFVACLLAIWRVGGVPLVLDPDWPEARRLGLVAAAGASWLIDAAGCRALPPGPPDQLVGGTAYLAATSGTSGVPKLVALGAAGYVQLLAEQTSVFQVGAQSRCLWLLGVGFDASLSDVGVALWSGATLVVANGEREQALARLPELLQTYSVSCADLPPAALRLWRPHELPDCLRTVVVGGAPSPPETLRSWAATRRLVAVYGPTEATICCAIRVVDAEQWDAPYLGDPMGGVAFETVDGELHIGGEAVGLGYVGMEPCGGFYRRGTVRWYRTGDRVTQGRHGLVFAGRTDRQLKLRGQRLAPEEVELALQTLPGVRDAHVWCDDHGRLQAAVEADAAPPAWLWKPTLARNLPHWAHPSEVVAWPHLPRLPSGKVDPVQLHAGTSQARPPTDVPRAGSERKLASLWRQVLGKKVGRTDDFFQIGGDSLAVVALLASARAAAMPLRTETVYRYPVLADQAQAVTGDRQPRPWRTYADLNAEVQRQWPVCGSSPRAVTVGGAIVVTGAAGQLGSAVVAALIRSGEPKVIALVRATGELAAGERMTAALLHHGIAQWPVSLRCLCADVAAPEFGLAADDYAGLAATVTVVVHCAGRVAVAAEPKDCEYANVATVARVLRFCSTGGRKRLVLASSLAVVALGGRATGRHVPQALTATHRLWGSYAQSKAAAEALAIAQQDGLAALSVVRLGLLVSPKPPWGDWLALSMRGLARLACIPWPTPRWRLDITPCTFAAEHLAALARSPADRTFVHLARRRGVTLAALTGAIESSGVALERVSIAQFRGRLAERAAAAPADAALAALQLAVPSRGGSARTLGLFLATGSDFCPDPAAPEDFAALLAHVAAAALAKPPRG